MEITRTAVGIVAAACVTAGAAGGYVLTRDPAPAASSAQEAAPTEAVEQSEAVVSDSSPAAVPVAPARPGVRAPAAPVRPSASARESAAPIEKPAPAPPAVEPATEIVPIAPAPIESAHASEAEVFRPVELPSVQYEDLVVAGDAVIGLQLETALSSETARVEDEVIARVTRDVKVGDRVAIPAGSKARGQVILVERGGKMRERARLGVRFTSIVLADGPLPIQTEPIYREGDSPGRETTTKIGVGAIGGAILGGIFGGAKGAAIGGSIGAGAGSAAVMAGGRNPATLSPGASITIQLREPATVTVER
ncbi:MAG TPA: hypothetical protein VFV95_11650 [Vicinamibacterales bacterium]|nr:hypothetical protein [Vicinamibacterales bacterium]